MVPTPDPLLFLFFTELKKSNRELIARLQVNGILLVKNCEGGGGGRRSGEGAMKIRALPNKGRRVYTMGYRNHF